MPTVFQYQDAVMLVIGLVLLAVKLFAFASSLLFSGESYRAAGKASKLPWAAGLGVGVVLQVLLPPLNIISIVFTVAAFVFLADVRPALSSLRRR